jgi:DNA-binding transcriptional regulator YhcF (GntR family)
LEREGTLVTQQGRGVFVAEPTNHLTKSARKKQLTEKLDLVVVEAVHLGFSADELLALLTERARQFDFPSDGGN